PDFIGARLTLARALRDRGARDEARAEAERAAALADRKGDAEDRAEAKELLDALREKPAG
ncbi:MAG TPA: hypothetical protein VKA21_16895, partial [Candidatus Binatia bacterium]|nr:hypothetical protein [Candidatus Binatia bacterium]